jgi:hypothetical protein
LLQGSQHRRLDVLRGRRLPTLRSHLFQGDRRRMILVPIVSHHPHRRSPSPRCRAIRPCG